MSQHGTSAPKRNTACQLLWGAHSSSMLVEAMLVVLDGGHYFLHVSCGQFHNHPFPQVSFPNQKNIIKTSHIIPNIIPTERNKTLNVRSTSLRRTRPPSATPLRCDVFDHRKWHLRRSRKQSHNPQGKFQGPHNACRKTPSHPYYSRTVDSHTVDGSCTSS